MSKVQSVEAVLAKIQKSEASITRMQGILVEQRLELKRAVQANLASLSKSCGNQLRFSVEAVNGKKTHKTRKERATNEQMNRFRMDVYEHDYTWDEMIDEAVRFHKISPEAARNNTDIDRTTRKMFLRPSALEKIGKKQKIA